VPWKRRITSSFSTRPEVATPNSKLVFHDVIWSDDKAAIRFTITGVHQADCMGVPASGREIVLPGITILRFKDDRVIERWSQADMLGLLVQLGAIPAPA
jgi:predicted ester cyclase